MVVMTTRLVSSKTTVPAMRSPFFKNKITVSALITPSVAKKSNAKGQGARRKAQSGRRQAPGARGLALCASRLALQGLGRFGIVWLGCEAQSRQVSCSHPAYPASHRESSRSIHLQPWPRVEEIVGSTRKDVAIRTETSIIEGMRPVSKEDVQVAQLVYLRIRPAEGKHASDGKDPKHFCPGSVCHSEIKPKLSLEVIGLLQDVSSDFGSGVGRPGRLGHPELLLPELGALDDIETFRRAGDVVVPIFDADGRQDRIVPGHT